MTKHHSSKFFQFITIIIISCLCLLLDSLTKIHFNVSSLPKNSPKYRAMGATALVYSKSGKLLYRMNSVEALKYPDDKKVYLNKVQLYFYDNKTGLLAYQINGDDGWVDENNRLGWLGHNVVAVIVGDNKNPATTIYGSNINLDLKNNEFTSKEFVRAVEGKSTLTATGFNYNKNTDVLTLNSKVRVMYVK